MALGSREIRPWLVDKESHEMQKSCPFQFQRYISLGGFERFAIKKSLTPATRHATVTYTVWP